MYLALNTIQHLTPLCALLLCLLHHSDTKEAHKELQHVLGVKSKIHGIALVRLAETHNASKNQKTKIKRTKVDAFHVIRHTPQANTHNHLL